MDSSFNIFVPELLELKTQEEKDRAIMEWMRCVNISVREKLLQIDKAIKESKANE